jgi:EpsI family protein
VLRPNQADSQWPALGRALGGPAAWGVALLVVAAANGTWALNRTVPGKWTQKMAAQAMPATLMMDGTAWSSRDLEMDQQTLDILETDDYLYRRYAAEGGQPVYFSIVFSKDNRKGTHPPDLCLEGSGQNIIAKADVVLTDVKGRGDVSCRAIITQSGRDREYYLYVYKCGDGYTPSFWWQQATIVVNGVLSRNSSGALVRVSTPVGDDLEAARRRCLRLLREAIPHLDETLP